jgi:SP family general alpha glucoside:H+ symporter-like MFS transporter
MSTEKITPTEGELKGLDLSNPETTSLIQYAQESDAADRLLTVRQAAKKYKKAVFWALILSTSLIMEGYDLVIVRNPFPFLSKQCRFIYPRRKPKRRR